MARTGGDEDSAKMLKAAEEALLKDRKFQSLVDMEIEKALKKYKVPAG